MRLHFKGTGSCWAAPFGCSEVKIRGREGERKREKEKTSFCAVGMYFEWTASAR